MAIANPNDFPETRGGSGGPGRTIGAAVARSQQWLAAARLFWKKVGNDWVPLFSTMLTYRLLTSAFSILLVIVDRLFGLEGILLGRAGDAER